MFHNLVVLQIKSDIHILSSQKLYEWNLQTKSNDLIDLVKYPLVYIWILTLKALNLYYNWWLLLLAVHWLMNSRFIYSCKPCSSVWVFVLCLVQVKSIKHYNNCRKRFISFNWLCWGFLCCLFLLRSFSWKDLNADKGAYFCAEWETTCQQIYLFSSIIKTFIGIL